MRAAYLLGVIAGVLNAQVPRTTGDQGVRCEAAALFSAEPCRPEVFTASWRQGPLEARAQLVIPGPGPVQYVVVIVGGGLIGHAAFTLDVWRSMCGRFQCALAHFDVLHDLPPETPATDPGRNAALGSGQALLALLDSLAKRTGRAEVAQSKLALFGHSATGSFTLTFAQRYPERTLTAVRYHSHLRGLAIDTVALSRVPVLMVASADDSTAGVEDMLGLWRRGRRSGAPWALAVERDRAHTSLDSWWEASDLIWHWIEALSKQRGSLAEVKAWFGEPTTRTIGHAAVAPSGIASWLPDSATAESWRRLSRGRL